MWQLLLCLTLVSVPGDTYSFGFDTPGPEAVPLRPHHIAVSPLLNPWPHPSEYLSPLALTVLIVGPCIFSPKLLFKTLGGPKEYQGFPLDLERIVAVFLEDSCKPFCRIPTRLPHDFHPISIYAKPFSENHVEVFR